LILLAPGRMRTSDQPFNSRLKPRNIYQHTGSSIHMNR
jgi:hypothetical protein